MSRMSSIVILVAAATLLSTLASAQDANENTVLRAKQQILGHAALRSIDLKGSTAQIVGGSDVLDVVLAEGEPFGTYSDLVFAFLDANPNVVYVDTSANPSNPIALILIPFEAGSKMNELLGTASAIVEIGTSPLFDDDDQCVEGKMGFHPGSGCSGCIKFFCANLGCHDCPATSDPMADFLSISIQQFDYESVIAFPTPAALPGWTENMEALPKHP